jgi:hypothetical protein
MTNCCRSKPAALPLVLVEALTGCRFEKPMNDGVPVRTAQLVLRLDTSDRISAPRKTADVFSGRGSMRALLTHRFPDAVLRSRDLAIEWPEAASIAFSLTIQRRAH